MKDFEWALVALAFAVLWFVGTLLHGLRAGMRSETTDKPKPPRPVIDLTPEPAPGTRGLLHKLRAGGAWLGDRVVGALLLLLAMAFFASILQQWFDLSLTGLARNYDRRGATAVAIELVMQVLMLALPTGFLLAWRRRRALARSKSVTVPPPGAVIYLRAFEDDERAAGTRWMPRVLPLPSQEEQLVQALADVGPVVAFSDPRNPMPSLGALRLRLSDSTWQRDLLGILAGARLVVMRVPVVASESVQWELQQVLNGAQRAKSLLVLPNSRRAVFNFNRLLAGRLAPLPVPTLMGRLLGPRTIGFCTVHSDGRVQFSPLRRPSFWRRSWWQRDLPGLRHTLQPLLAARGIAVRGAGLRWGRIAALVVLTLPVLLVALGLLGGMMG